MISVNASKLSNSPSTGWPKEQVTEESVNRLFVEKFKSIVTSYEERKNNPTIQGLKWLAKTGHKIGENKLSFTHLNKKIEGKNGTQKAYRRIQGQSSFRSS